MGGGGLGVAALHQWRCRARADSGWTARTSTKGI